MHIGMGWDAFKAIIHNFLPLFNFHFLVFFLIFFKLNLFFPEGSEEFELASSADDEVSEKDGKCQGERSDEAGEHGDVDDDIADDGLV